MTTPCPCGTGRDYADCCGPFHAGADAPTAEQLMRARYCAYARGDAAFLVRSSHPLLRAKIDQRSLRRSFAVAWSGLEVVQTEAGGPDDTTGMVHFKARYRAAGGEQIMEERSRFVRDGSAWVYRDARG